MKKLRTLEKRVKDYAEIQNAVDDAELELELWKEGDSTEEASNESYATALNIIENVEFKMTLNKPED